MPDLPAIVAAVTRIVMIHFYSTRNLPAITDVGRDSISGGSGSVCGSDVKGVVGAAATEKALNDVSSDNCGSTYRWVDPVA